MISDPCERATATAQSDALKEQDYKPSPVITTKITLPKYTYAGEFAWCAPRMKYIVDMKGVGYTTLKDAL